MLQKNDMEIFRRYFLTRLKRYKNLDGSLISSIMSSFDHCRWEANLEITGLKKPGQCPKKKAKDVGIEEFESHLKLTHDRDKDQIYGKQWKQ